jgi:bacteriocin biosynthesis cyclodehydratase domain-containing protein
MRLPRIKISCRPIRFGVERVRIGDAACGPVFDVADPDGWFWELLALLDGSRTGDQVVAELSLSFPGRSAEVPVAIGELLLMGYLEDAGEPEPTELTEAERERYSRGKELSQRLNRTSLTGSWDAQEALKRAKVLVLGLGGVGAYVALACTVSGVGRIHCVDRDVVSLSDLNRQILYLQQDLNWPKADTAVRRLRERNSDVEITGERGDIQSPEAVAAIIEGFDVVVLAADSPPEIVSWTNRACHEAGIPWVWGGYDGPLTTVGVFRPGAGPCYDCARTAKRERSAGSLPLTDWPPAVGVVVPHAANVVTVTFAGALVTNAVTSLLTGTPALPANGLYQLDVTSIELHPVGPDAPHPRCPTCGHAS